jgi:putative spermidine/putrescine transport system permease protein
MSMAQALPDDGVMRAADGTPLKVALARAERRERLKALGLVAPLFAFIVLSFVVPIIVMLYNSVYDPDVAQTLPRTVEALSTWDGKELPSEDVYAALAADMKEASNQQVALVGKRLNYEMSGIRSKVINTGRKVKQLEQGPYKDALIGMDKIWGNPETWSTIKRSSSDWTPFYILSMLDLRQSPDGGIEAIPADRAIYKDILVRTLGISLLVTVMTLILGYPVAYLLATSPQKTAAILMIFVLLPFWTSLLVRTTAWMILMQDGGVFTQLLNITGITWLLNLFGAVDGEPQLFKTRFSTIVAMTHIQLPFTLLPIYSVMKTISPNYMRAAKSLGGTPFYCFLRVYMPQTIPGVAAGCLLTFILCLGYYITPALVGGPTDQMISGFIERAINSENNWGKASALGVILLIATLILYYVYNKLIGIDRMKLG